MKRIVATESGKNKTGIRVGCKVLIVLASLLAWLSGQAQGCTPYAPRVTTDSVPVVYTQAEINSAATTIYNNSGDKSQLAKGILDVTKPPYNAIPNDGSDDWAGIQKAVYDAMRYKAVCFFPGGTYHVSKQISCPMPAIRKTTPSTPPYAGDIAACLAYHCVLVGDRSGPKPVIQLMDGASGFSDPSKPKDIIHFWAVYIHEGTDTTPDKKIEETFERPNMTYNHRLEYVKISTGTNNPGAAGVYMWGMQGCVIEDVEVDATNSFAGMRGIPGAGAITRGLTVTGGRYGIYASYGQFCGTGNLPQIVGSTLTGQTVNNIYGSEILETMTLTGCRLQMSTGMNSIYVRGGRGFVNLTDCQIERPGSGGAISLNKGIYLDNVYVKNAAKIVDYAAGTDLAGVPDKWVHVNEYSDCDTDTTNEARYLNGAVVSSALSNLDPTSVSVPPPGDLMKRHWPPETSLPHHKATNVIDITSLGANGADQNDDYAKIQAALNTAHAEGKDVFIPRGKFFITNTLVLPEDVALFGVDQSYSEILIKGNTFTNKNAEIPMLKSDPNAQDQAAATASVAKVGFLSPIVSGVPYEGVYGVRWQYGRNSYIRDATFSYDPYANATYKRYRDIPWFLIDGNGGGRWYNLQRPNRSDRDEMTVNYRHLKVSNTTEPLTFYTCNVIERAWDSPTAMELDNADNVTIYSMKHENEHTGTPDYKAQALLASNCRNLRVFGYGGNANGDTDLPLIDLRNCTNLLLANVGSQQFISSVPGWLLVQDANGPVKVTPNKKILYYKRGAPSGSAPNFTSQPVVKANAKAGTAYIGPTLAGNIADEDKTGNYTFEKIRYDSPAGATDWLTLASNGALSGTPRANQGNVGQNNWTVSVTDGAGLTAVGSMRILVESDDSDVKGFELFAW